MLMLVCIWKSKFANASLVLFPLPIIMWSLQYVDICNGGHLQVLLLQSGWSTVKINALLNPPEFKTILWPLLMSVNCSRAVQNPIWLWCVWGLVSAPHSLFSSCLSQLGKRATESMQCLLCNLDIRKPSLCFLWHRTTINKNGQKR